VRRISTDTLVVTNPTGELKLLFHPTGWKGASEWQVYLFQKSGVARSPCRFSSHVIVLFDFIEEMHEKGEPLERALPDAGIERIRPVMITVGATILALFPLALEGGPLWKPLCYAQIGGLAVATFITLLLVPVFYAIFVLDLKWITWDVTAKER
jgi:AcrB/AcrD/AcrF family